MRHIPKKNYKKLGRAINEIANHYDYIYLLNNGGCGIFAYYLSTYLMMYGIKHKFVLYEPSFIIKLNTPDENGSRYKCVYHPHYRETVMEGLNKYKYISFSHISVWIPNYGEINSLNCYHYFDLSPYDSLKFRKCLLNSIKARSLWNDSYKRKHNSELKNDLKKIFLSLSHI